MFTGSIVAIVTPMDEKGNVCRASLKKLIDYHVASRYFGDRFCWHHWRVRYLKS
ncbi:dihydrodipicolinate synthase [Escherichia coli]|nr:dihydrodipicolinate synthase [Escherichia coli]